MPPVRPAAAGRVFRPRSSLAAVIVGALVALAWAWAAVAAGGVPGLARQVPGILLAATGAYAVLVRPSVEVGPAGVTLRNVVRDVDVPWAALAEVRTRYALMLVTTDGRRFTAWAAPASGRHTDTRLTRREAGAIGWEPDADLPTASASSESHSGAVAAWIRREWSRAVETADPDEPDETPADTRGTSGTSGTRDTRGTIGPDPVPTVRVARGLLAVLAATLGLVVVAALT